jgi:23S rRNA pseudouridine2457 synthase
MLNLLLFNKPFNVLCQFTDDSEQASSRENLSDYIKKTGYYAAGRLDRDSEGLLLLTDNGKLQQRIADPKFKLPKTYLVQVEGEINSAAIAQLQKGVVLKDGKTLPAQAKKVSEPLWLWSRNPPIRERQNIPTSWLELTIKEGKNRQVRRMTAAVGFPTLRLIRIQIGPWKIADLSLGTSQQIAVDEFKQQLPEGFLNFSKTTPNHKPRKAIRNQRRNAVQPISTTKKRRSFDSRRKKPAK